MKRCGYVGVLLALGFCLSACGGGGGGGSTSSSSVDPNAHKFIIGVTTSRLKVGSTGPTEFQITTRDTEYTYNYNVDCDNDGEFEATELTGDYICTYSEANATQIAIEGDFPAFKGGIDAVKIDEIVQWGSIEWQSMKEAFMSCTNMTSSATDKPDLSNVEDMSYMFYSATLFDANISDWDVSNVTNMSRLFSRMDFNQSIGNWDVSNVTSFYAMFSRNDAFNQDISSWNVGNVGSAVDMASMFERAVMFNQDISSWNVSNVTDMSYMFSGATNFDQNLGTWNIGSVTDMTKMFLSVQLSTANYDATLKGWYERGNMIHGITFGGGLSKYSSTGGGEAARDGLVSVYGWIIDDGGLE